MAVIYSKLGGCLGVTAKLGPLARTDLCAGVKGLLERLMTHLGLCSSLEEPWLDLLGGVEVGLPSLEVAQASWEGWAGCCLGECLVPCLLALGGVITMPCLGCPRGLRVTSYRRRSGLGRIVFFPWGSETSLLGRAVIFRGKVYSSRERIASFPRRKVSNCQHMVGRRTLTVCLIVYWINCYIINVISLAVKETVTFRWKVDSCRGRTASFPRRKESNCQHMVGRRTLTVCLIVYWINCYIINVISLAVKETVTFRWKVDSCRGRTASFPRRKESSGRSRVVGTGRGWNLPVYRISYVIVSNSYSYISFLFRH